jgi:hypothetical protein
VKREPTLIEFGVAVFATLLASFLAGQLVYWICSPQGQTFSVMSHGGSFRSAALEACALVALLAISRRGARELRLFACSLAIAAVVLSASQVGGWLSAQLAPAFGGRPTTRTLATLLHDLIRSRTSLSGIVTLAFLALGNCLATLGRRTLFAGAAVSLGIVPNAIMIVIDRRYPDGYRTASTLYYLTAFVVASVLFPLAVRLVPRAFETLGLSQPPDPVTGSPPQVGKRDEQDHARPDHEE